MRKAIAGAALVLLASALVAAACGDGEEEEGGTTATGTTPTGTAATSGAVDMKADDFFFAPEQLEGNVGEAVTVEVENEGQVSHTFTIDELGVDQTLAPGEKATVTFTPDQDGAFSFYCRFHRSQGMEGALSVSGGS